jgi:Lipase 3 N-terminal region
MSTCGGVIHAFPPLSYILTVNADVTVTDADFANFELFAQYSAASYCTDNDNSSDSLIACSSSACPLVEAAGAVGVVEFNA